MRVSANCVQESSLNLSIMSRFNYRREKRPEDIAKFYCIAEKDPDGFKKTKYSFSINEIILFSKSLVARCWKYKSIYRSSLNFSLICLIFIVFFSCSVLNLMTCFTYILNNICLIIGCIKVHRYLMVCDFNISFIKKNVVEESKN